MKSNQNSKFMKQIGLTLISCMLIQFLPTNILNVKEAYAATGFRHVTVGDSEVILGGNYIEVGITKSGSFGTTNKTDDFHSTFPGIGLAVDGDGFDTGNPPTTGDFFLPGDPEESFTVGYKFDSSSAIPEVYTNAERMGIVQIPMTTKDTTEGELLSAVSSGKTIDSNLEISQKISFKIDNKFFKNTLTTTNTGAETLYDVRYMRSFDPDQDRTYQETPVTNNIVLENFPQNSRAIVRASGAVTKEPVFFISTDSRARASSFGFSNRDPYDKSAYQTDGSQLKKGEVLDDQAIAITFALGNLAPGKSVTFEYYTSLDPNYESGLDDIMGSLGLQINEGAVKTNSLNVTLNLNGYNVKEMCFSNDDLSYSDFEPYTASKAWTLTSGRGLKTVYAKFRDSKNNESTLVRSIEYNSIPTVTDASVSMGFENPYTFAGLDFSADDVFKDADGDVLDRIKITALPTKGLLQLNGNNVVNEKILAADLSNLVYLPGESYYSEDSFNWIATDGSDYSVSEAKMTIIIKPGLPLAPEKFLISPLKDQIILGGNSIKLEWSSAKSNSGTPMTYKLDFFDGNLWSTLSEVTETSYEFKDTLGKNTDSAKFRVSAMDEVGNSGYTLSDNFMIDSVSPSITSILQTPTTWTAGNVTLTVEANDKLSGLSEKPYSFDEGTTWQASGSKTFEENTASIIMVKDQAGNITKLEAIKIDHIDKVSPTGTIMVDRLNWKEVISKITFGLFFKDSIQVTITAEDTSSGIEKMEYAKLSTELTLEEVQNISEWTIYTKPFVETADNEKQVIYYVKLTDYAGNITYLNSDGIIFDKKAPGVMGIKDKETYYVDQIITVSDLYMDTLTINGEPFVSGSSLQGDKEATYAIMAKDKAGNPTSYTVYSQTISSLDDSVEGITGGSVKSSDKAEIEAVLYKVMTVIGTTKNGATEEQIKALETMKKNLESLLVEIQDMKDHLAGVDEKVNEITLENVNKEDQILLKQSAAQYEKTLVDFKDNLTDEEKTLLQKKINTITEMVTALDAVIAVENKLSALPDLNNLHSNDLENAKKACSAYDELTDHQKSLFEPELKIKYDNLMKTFGNVLLEDPKTGAKMEGLDGTCFNLKTQLVVTPSMDKLNGETKALISNGVIAVAKDKSVAELYEIQLLLDGKPVQPDGNIKVSLRITEKMKSFKDLQVIYVTEDGTVTIIPSEQMGDEIVFLTDHLSYYGVIGTIVKTDTYPKTGDSTSPLPYYFLGAASLLLAFVLIKKSKLDNIIVE